MLKNVQYTVERACDTHLVLEVKVWAQIIMCVFVYRPILYSEFDVHCGKCIICVCDNECSA